MNCALLLRTHFCVLELIKFRWIHCKSSTHLLLLYNLFALDASSWKGSYCCGVFTNFSRWSHCVKLSSIVLSFWWRVQSNSQAPLSSWHNKIRIKANIILNVPVWTTTKQLPSNNYKNFEMLMIYFLINLKTFSISLNVFGIILNNVHHMGAKYFISSFCLFCSFCLLFAEF